MEETYNIYASKVDGSLRKMSALKSLIFSEELSGQDIQILKEFKCVQDFLTSQNNSKQEFDLKKIFAGSIIAGMEFGALPFKLPNDFTTESIVSLIDEGLTRLKVAYQQNSGLIEDEYEAQEIILEHQAVRTATFTEIAIEKGLKLANVAIDKAESKTNDCVDFLIDNSEKIFSIIGAAYPSVKPVAKVCGVVLSYFKPTMKDYANKGIKSIAKVAKTYLHSVIKETPERIKKIVKLLS